MCICYAHLVLTSSTGFQTLWTLHCRTNFLHIMSCRNVLVRAFHWHIFRTPATSLRQNISSKLFFLDTAAWKSPVRAWDGVLGHARPSSRLVCPSTFKKICHASENEEVGGAKMKWRVAGEVHSHPLTSHVRKAS